MGWLTAMVVFNDTTVTPICRSNCLSRPPAVPLLQDENVSRMKDFSCSTRVPCCRIHVVQRYMVIDVMYRINPVFVWKLETSAFAYCHPKNALRSPLCVVVLAVLAALVALVALVVFVILVVFVAFLGDFSVNSCAMDFFKKSFP